MQLWARAILIATAFVAGCLYFQVGTGHAGATGKRVALVVGNSAYSAVEPLKNARGDAEAMAETLRKLGFDTHVALDVDQAVLQANVAEFAKAAEGSETALVFYAGHGFQLGSENMLVPTDFKPEAMILGGHGGAVPVSQMLAAVDGARTRIVLLDACRKSPGEASPLSLGIRLRSLHSPTRTSPSYGPLHISKPGTLVAYSTGVSETASDGDTQHSPFTAALLKHLPQPGLDLYSLMTKVRHEVIGATSAAGDSKVQVPWSESSLLGEVFLIPSVPSHRPNRTTPSKSQPGHRSGGGGAAGKVGLPPSAGEGGVSF